MKEFEDQLRQALRRREPPDGFARRVAGKAAASRRPAAAKWLGAAIAASLLLLVGGMQYQRYRGERAKEQLMMAVEITAEKITLVRRNLQHLDTGSVQ
jgi:hypothetical protein